MYEVLDRYLDEFYYNELFENNDSEIVKNIDYNNAKKVLEVFEKYNFYFIEDIIVGCFEILMMDYKTVEKGILKLKNKLGENYLFQIGDDLSLLEEIIRLNSK